MIDSVQLVLLLVIVVLTVLLVVLGIQVYFILKDIRKALVKANKVLENAGSITDNVSGPISSLAALITSFKAGSLLTLAKFIRTLMSKDDNNEDKKNK
jgi:sensor domain CHASE-containing protein